MIENLASRIVDKLIAHNSIDDAKTEMYQYGFEIFISTFITCFITIIVGMLLQCIWSALVYFIMFALLRSLCGGYHAKTYFQCNFIYTLTTATILLFFKYMPIENFTVFHYCGLLLTIVVVSVYAPLDSRNKPIAESNKEKYRFFSIAMVVMLALLSCMLEIKLRSSYCILIDMTLVVVALSMLVIIPERR